MVIVRAVCILQSYILKLTFTFSSILFYSIKPKLKYYAIIIIILHKIIYVNII